MKKKNLVKMLATVACATSIWGIGAWNAQASADAKVGTVDVSSFRMTYGASVRFKANDGKNGIRFTATMAETAYNGLEELQTSDDISVNYGMLIVPEDMTELVANPQAAFGAEYALEDCDENSDTCSCGKTHLAAVTYDTLSVKDGTATLRGSLVDVKSGNLTRAFVGMGYIEYTTGSTTTRYFAKNALDEAGTAGSEDVKNNTRSMTHVSQLAVEDGEDDKESTLYNTYIKPIETNGKKYYYTINHYIPTTDGYELVGTETKKATLNTKVAATNIAKSTLENKADYKDYATYSFDSSLGEVNSTVYPNGRTVLNCYYKAVDTKIWDAENDDDVALWVNNGNALQEMPADETAMVAATKYYKSGVTYTDGNEVTRENVLQFVENEGNYQYGVGQLYASFAEEKLQQLADSNWDYLSFKMCMVPTTVSTGESAAASMAMYSGNVKLGNIPTNEWVEFIVPKALLNSNGSIFVGNKEALKADVDFDYKMSTGNTSVCAAGTKSALFYSNTVKNNTAGTHSCTYYFDEVSYGVDCSAPEIKSVSSPIDGQSYTPEVVVEDDIVGTLVNATQKCNALYSTTLYEEDVASGNRTELTATDGAYNLTKSADKKYILAVFATDASVTDIDGNELYEEIEVVIRDATEIVGINSKYDLNDLGITTFRSDSLNETIIPKVTYLESYTDSANNTVYGVAKYDTRKVITTDYGAFFYLNMSTTEANNVLNAFKNSSNFTLNLKMCINVENFTNSNDTMIRLYKNAYLTDEPGFAFNTWQELTIDSATLFSKSGSTLSDANILKMLTGEEYLFYLTGYTFDWDKKVNNNVTYYVDSITYTATNA